MIEPLTLDELRESWPKDESGALAVRLLQRYFYTLGIESALGAECDAARAQAEASANKVIAKITKDVSSLTVQVEPQQGMTRMKPLKRFSAEDKKPETK